MCTHGLRTTATGALGMDGPPTMFSGTGVDRMAFLQANVTQDNTEIVNGATIGDRCIFQLDQGLGIGSKNPFFNRHQLTMTKFMNLNKQENGAGKPLPVVLVAHGRYAGCVGDLPSYETFPLGGPHSVRGYGMGELGASRNLLEASIYITKRIYKVLPIRHFSRQCHFEHVWLLPWCKYAWPGPSLRTACELFAC